MSGPLPKRKPELFQRELPFDELETAPPQTKRQTRAAVYQMLQRTPATARPTTEAKPNGQSEVTS
jgi:hypothetical protein